MPHDPLPNRAGDQVVIFVGGATVLVVAVLVVAVSVWLTYEHSLLHVMDVENDNGDAITYFLRVLDQAERELLLHDDGDKANGSLYDDEGTVQAVRNRLKSRPNLRIRCLLNFKEDVAMSTLRDEYGDRFQVRYVGGRPADDVHFKIADGGKMAYLTTHPPGIANRQGQFIDGRQTSERVRKSHLGGLITDFNEGFDRARSA